MLRFEDWGLIDYEQALNKQLEKVTEIIESQSSPHPKPGFLIFCTHPPVVTLGRKTQDGDVFAWTGEIKEISRGGRATYHGPSQLVVYPIVNMEIAGPRRKAKDIASLLRTTEDAIVNVLKSYGIQAQGRSEPIEETGVWVGTQKVASLGIGVKHWVSYHGAAINLEEDPQAFVGMKPCGFSRETMISLEKLTGKKIDRQEFSIRLQEILLASL